MSDEVSKLLRADLVRLGLTQEEFANKLGVTQQAVSAWCARDAIPYRRLKAIENALGSDSQLVAYMRDLPQPQILRDRSGEFHTIRELTEIQRLPPPKLVKYRSGSGRSGIMVKAYADHRKFRDLIESELPGNRTDVSVQIGEMRRRYDYMSDSLCFQLLPLAPLDGHALLNSARLYATLIPLMLCRHVTGEDFPDRHFGIIVIADDSKLEKSEHYARLRWECEQFGVSLTVEPQIEAAANLIIRIETSMDDDEADL